MKTNIAATSILFLLAILCQAPAFAQQGPWKNLFTGKNLKRWQVPEGNNCWLVKEGILMVQSDEEQTGSILWTKKDYTDFVVKADFKFGEGTVDSGIFLRDESQQIQIGESGSLKRDMTASPYIVGKMYPVEAEGVTALLKLEDWNTIEVKAVGKTYSVTLNGKQVMTYTSEEAPKTKGPIGIQLHPKRDMTIFYKDIKVAQIK